MSDKQRDEQRDERLAARHQNSCLHFRGYHHTTCKAGVNWRKLVGGDAVGIAVRAPCYRDNQSIVACASCHYPTPEETAAYIADLNTYLARQHADGIIINDAHRAQNMPVSQVYVCELCDRAARHVTTSRAAMIVHWREIHALQPEQWESCTSHFLAHSDAREWSQDDTRHTMIDGRDLLLHSVRTRRRGDDAAWWGGE